jgi:hypothetical protein
VSHQHSAKLLSLKTSLCHQTKKTQLPYSCASGQFSQTGRPAGQRTGSWVFLFVWLVFLGFFGAGIQPEPHTRWASALMLGYIPRLAGCTVTNSVSLLLVQDGGKAQFNNRCRFVFPLLLLLCTQYAGIPEARGRNVWLSKDSRWLTFFVPVDLVPSASASYACSSPTLEPKQQSFHKASRP